MAVNGDRVLIVDNNEIIELEVPSHRKCFLADTFLKAAISCEAPDPIVDDVKAGPVVCGC
jgi:hypothetical protein